MQELREDWPSHLPIQHDILKVESPAVHAYAPWVDGTFLSFSLVYTKTSYSSACLTSWETALIRHACEEKISFLRQDYKGSS